VLTTRGSPREQAPECRLASVLMLATAGSAFSLIALLVPPSALGHPAKPPPPPVYPPREVEEIPAEDEDQYRSYVTAIRPRIPGLKAGIIGNQEKLEVTWTGRRPLIVEGSQGEPMARMNSKGIFLNELSPTAYLSTERYGRASLPVTADPSAEPDWRLVETPGPISWYEHRAQWMEAERPAIVGDGTRGVTIFHWKVPARLGGREVSIRGALDWVPDPAAIREQRSDVSSPLLSAAILIAAGGFGWLAGLWVRRRVAPEIAA
jgi:hypothetical protein